MQKYRFRRHRPLFSTQLPDNVRKAKIRWKVLPILWAGIKRTAMALGFLMIINFAVMAVILLSVPSGGAPAPKMPSKAVLFLELDGEYADVPEFGGLSDPFAQTRPTLREVVDAIDKAAKDKRVKGLLARMNGGHFDMSRTYELRAALKRFRAAEKFAYIYSRSYGEGAGGLGRYYLASAFDEIWMQPLGVVEVTGVSAEIPFARAVLDKLGVSPQFFQRKEYKSAMESITNTEISAANREEMTAIVDAIRAEILRDIPADRKMSAAAFEALVNKGLLTAKEAVKGGLVDHADYGDVLLENIAEKIYGERDADLIEFVDVPFYPALAAHGDVMAQIAPHGLHKVPKVALVYASGPIVSSADDGGEFSEGAVVAADDLAPDLYDIADDPSYAAVVLRIDSPGGSPTASESILRAIEKVRESGKPVVVSMGSAAASGGYWIAAYADRIFAAPTTLTGSIGVFGGKVATAELSEKIGVNWEKISWGENAGIWSVNTPFSETEAERMNAMMDQIYDSFLARVSKGRKMSVAAVEKVARGRVWTGREALKAGLVDEIGGLNEALDYAATLAGKKTRADVDVEIVPKPKTQIEMLIELLGAQVSMMSRGLQVQAQIGEILSPLSSAAAVYKNPRNYAVFEPLRLE